MKKPKNLNSIAYAQGVLKRIQRYQVRTLGYCDTRLDEIIRWMEFLKVNPKVIAYVENV